MANLLLHSYQLMQKYTHLKPQAAPSRDGHQPDFNLQKLQNQFVKFQDHYLTNFEQIMSSLAANPKSSAFDAESQK